MLRKNLVLGMADSLTTDSCGFSPHPRPQQPTKSGGKSVIAFSVNDVEGVIGGDAIRIVRKQEAAAWRLRFYNS
ncbi:MAG: hypothetical protein LBG43_10045 [Treponema sp.]|jgi:hypothetical protein|nr:hypothetical protein [Treponema sp.]